MPVVDVGQLIAWLEVRKASAQKDADEQRRNIDREAAEYHDGKAAAWSELINRLREGL